MGWGSTREEEKREEERGRVDQDSKEGRQGPWLNDRVIQESETGAREANLIGWRCLG